MLWQVVSFRFLLREELVYKVEQLQGIIIRIIVFSVVPEIDFYSKRLITEILGGEMNGTFYH